MYSDSYTTSSRRWAYPVSAAVIEPCGLRLHFPCLFPVSTSKPGATVSICHEYLGESHRQMAFDYLYNLCGSPWETKPCRAIAFEQRSEEKVPPSTSERLNTKVTVRCKRLCTEMPYVTPLSAVLGEVVCASCRNFQKVQRWLRKCSPGVSNTPAGGFANS